MEDENGDFCCRWTEESKMLLVMKGFWGEGRTWRVLPWRVWARGRRRMRWTARERVSETLKKFSLKGLLPKGGSL